MICVQPSPELARLVNQAVGDAVDRKMLKKARFEILRCGVNNKRQINYEQLAWEYAYTYFWPNYCKVRVACDELDWRPVAGQPVRILDLGCGNGAGLAGVVDHLRRTLNFRGAIHATAIEASDRQVQLLADLTKPYLDQQGATLNVERLDVRDATFDKGYSLVLASYLLDELDSQSRFDVLSQVWDVVYMRPTDVLIVEAVESPIFTQAAEIGAWPTYHQIQTPISLPTECLRSDGSSKRTFTLAAGLFRGLRWCQDNVPKALADYRIAWEELDPARIRDLFYTDATYEIDPNRVLNGIEEICSYWEQNSRVQKDVRFSISRWSRLADFVFADWNAMLERTDLGKLLTLRGALRLEVKNTRVQRLSEYYTRHEQSAYRN